MKKLLIVGAGGHGKVVADAASSSGSWSAISFVDDNFCAGDNVAGYPVIGKLCDLPDLKNEWTSSIVAIGDNNIRSATQNSLVAMGFSMVNVIHPLAYISPNATLGVGVVAFACSVINVGAVIGDSCIVNTGAIIDHDCSLGNGVHVSPGVSLGGTVKIGEFSWIGIGASIKNNITIGSNVIVGAGAAVISDIQNNLTVVGVPAIPVNQAI